MGIVLSMALEEGWKADEKGRFGPVLVVNFVNKADGKVLFSYAPKLDERAKWDAMWDALAKYDTGLVAVRESLEVFKK